MVPPACALWGFIVIGNSCLLCINVAATPHHNALSLGNDTSNKVSINAHIQHAINWKTCFFFPLFSAPDVRSSTKQRQGDWWMKRGGRGGRDGGGNGEISPCYRREFKNINKTNREHRTEFNVQVSSIWSYISLHCFIVIHCCVVRRPQWMWGWHEPAKIWRHSQLPITVMLLTLLLWIKLTAGPTPGICKCKCCANAKTTGALRWSYKAEWLQQVQQNDNAL